MRNLLACILLVILAFAWRDTPAGDDARKKPRVSSQLPAQLWKTRPVRRDTPLREENISDLEVIQIEAEMKSLYPGSVVYISAVTTGCPCEDGPDCTDLVWSVATLTDKSKGIALSRIDGDWQVGPLQRWWLDHDEIRAAYQASRKAPREKDMISFHEYLEQVEKHKEMFPSCSEGPTTDDIRIAAVASDRVHKAQRVEGLGMPGEQIGHAVITGSHAGRWNWTSQ